MSAAPDNIDQLCLTVRLQLQVLPAELLEYVLTSIEVAYLMGREEVAKQSLADLKELVGKA